MSGFAPVDEQMKILARGAVEILPEAEFRERLQASRDSGTPLRIKEGFDASAPDLHLGHTVQLRKLRQFQDLGHDVIFLIGDFTAMIGDPSGKSSTRPMLSREEVLENAESYRRQVFKVLREDRTRVVFNSEWALKMSSVDVLRLSSEYTVARMLERDDFEKRYKGNQPISIQEFLYPLFQGYDSVVLKSDVEVGGTDQKFNLLVGRELQRGRGMKPQCVLTLPLLVGTDGKEKMSKSLGNAVGIEEPADQIFGKVMSIPDELMAEWFDLVSDLDAGERAAVQARLDDTSVNPGQIKRQLARNICEQYHGAGAGESAEAAFDRIFVQKDRPDDVPEYHLAASADGHWLVGLIAEAGLAPSKKEARRLLQQGGVSIDEKRISDEKYNLPATSGSTYLLRVGKRRFLSLIVD
ncbi:tyrosine--tRNA ligase [bacterium]|nr:MAG: tyrosine--tRNA ligase [bacterium]